MDNIPMTRNWHKNEIQKMNTSVEFQVFLLVGDYEFGERHHDKTNSFLATYTQFCKKN